MSLTLTADFRELNEYLARLTKKEPEIKPALFEVVKEVAMELDTRVDNAMPVDTGRARAGWGKYNPDLLEGSMETLGRHFFTRPSRGGAGRPQISSEADAIWEEYPEEIAVVEGTHVPYVELLNEGHSTQAPAGFIDMAVEAASLQLEAKAAARFEKELANL